MRHPDYDNALEALLACQSETVPASMIAPILNMNPGVIIKYAKDGTWDRDKWGNFVISGDRVKFFRRDFLHKCGLMGQEPEKPTVQQLLTGIMEELHNIRLVMSAQLSIGQILRLEQLVEKEKDRQRGNADGVTEVHENVHE